MLVKHNAKTIITFPKQLRYRYHGRRYPWSVEDEKVLQHSMRKILARDVFPKASEIRAAFVDGSVQVKAIWLRYNCPDWRSKCIEKVKNKYKKKGQK